MRDIIVGYAIWLSYLYQLLDLKNHSTAPRLFVIRDKQVLNFFIIFTLINFREFITAN
jgi:hypothetical protein